MAVIGLALAVFLLNATSGVGCYGDRVAHELDTPECIYFPPERSAEERDEGDSRDTRVEDDVADVALSRGAPNGADAT